ncbi:MAG: M28 family peptidase [Phycisphaerales bacterium]|nr:M28 family peptidase [Phycisphaerales bacterium]
MTPTAVHHHPRRLRWLACPLVIAAASLALAAGPRIADVDPARPTEAMLAADSATFHKHATTLSNPFFEGRAPGSRGNQIAADYIEFYFKRLGLKPAFPSNPAPASADESPDDAADKAVPGNETKEGDQAAEPAPDAAQPAAADPNTKPFSSYRQPFPFGSSVSMKDAAVTIDGPAPTSLTPGTDFTVLGFSGDAEATGPLVFIGYGINIGKDGYSSFPANTDLKGKIAVVFRFEPMSEAGKSQWDDGGWSWNAALEPKITQAAKYGAAGVILVCPPGADDDRTTKLETIDNTKPAGKAAEIPVIQMSIAQAEKLIAAADEQGRSLLDLRKLADDLAAVTENGSVVDLPKATVTLKTKVAREPIITANIGGILPGAGPLADQYIVIGAHYDHVGYGLFGSRGGPGDRGKIHPGADDNASGTSGLLMVAEKLVAEYAAMPADAPRRSILFMGFTAEESGLNGSRHYVKNMIVPKEQHAIMFNMDMIGRYRGDDDKGMPMELGGVATAKGLLDLIQPAMDSSGLKITPKPGGYGPSDHASFFGAGIPVLFCFTGLHEQYHSPADTADTLNAHGAARIVSLVDEFAMLCATRPERFEYNGEAESEQSAATGDEAPRQPRSRIRFGIMPGDYSGNDGILVGDVTEGTSADEAGIKKGDKLTKWNGEALSSVESWMPLLAKHSPGDVVDVTLLRGEEEIVVKVTLKARRGSTQ